jgi:hypothetical protein
MNQNAPLGTNLTGIAVAPSRAQEMVAGMEEFPPSSGGSAQAVAQVRIAYAKQAEAMGSVPMPPSVMDKVKTVVKAVTGAHPTLFMDKLGERLAFERAGVRLYEALLSKYDAFGGFSGGPSREDLAHNLNEEYQHFALLQEVIKQCGGDPTAVTPSANLQAVASLGINMLLLDPRVTLLQSLEAMVVTELTDRECWEALTELATIAGERELSMRFAQAQRTEQEHLAKVRTWLAAGQGRRGTDGDGAA